MQILPRLYHPFGGSEFDCGSESWVRGGIRHVQYEVLFLWSERRVTVPCELTDLFPLLELLPSVLIT